MKSNQRIIADFNAIADALAQCPPRDRLTPAERALLRHVPPAARRAIDVGCGDGVVARALARRGLDVTGVDLSPQMTALARARTSADFTVQYVAGDIMSETIPLDSFDVVLSINMVHHLNLRSVVPRLAGLVAPSGVLLVQDVVTRRGIRYLPANIAGAIQRRYWRVHSRSRSRAVDSLYDQHGQGETYLTPAQVEIVYRGLLPGVRLEHHAEWRYSAIWSNSPAANRR